MTEDWRVNRVDELTLRDRTENGSLRPVTFDHNDLHQVENRYTWTVNGNISTRTGGPHGDGVFTHDWRDRLISVEQGSTATDILVDPLGRMVGKVRHTPDGDVARAYLHDVDQVVVEYVQPAGATTWRPDRRHIWSTWIDQLAVEQVDTDGGGSLETTLYPITDMLGSVQLLTDNMGKIVERIEYDPDGTPHFASADTQDPVVNRIVWTGDGTMPTGDTTNPQAIEIGFSEVIDAASVGAATATLTPEGGSPASLTRALAAEGRSAELTGATVQAGITYALHIEGLRDPSGNQLSPEDRMVVVADAGVFEVLTDTTPPLLVALMDAVDGVYLLFDEAVTAPDGDLSTAVTITRQGVAVDGETTRVEANVLKWTPAEAVTWLPGAQYTLSAVDVEDLAANAAVVASMAFTHLATESDQLLIARQAATESVPVGASAYGVTTLFQGRTWHSDLGMYYYRARWYLPEGGVFGERDPVGYGDSSNLYQAFGFDGYNYFDPNGLALYAFDGTGNDPADNTNVWILKTRYIDKDGGRSFYQKGVGTNWWTAYIGGGGSGGGTRRRIRKAYAQFKENWKNRDKSVDIIGFSRGAAAAREFAWYLWSRGARDDNGNVVTLQIRFLGIFDTVYSMGFPGNDFDFGCENRLPENILHVRHAVARGERRFGFELTSILPRRGYSKHIGTRVEREFPGAHSDVCGGYDDNRTAANRVLLWMWEQAKAIGVPFGSLPEGNLPKSSDVLMVHDSTSSDEPVTSQELDERNKGSRRKIYRPVY